LVVEDEPGVRRLVAAALRDAGHHVVEFETAEQAEGALSAGRGRIDIAIVDLSLPGMSGAEFVDELAKRRPELPALLVSGHFTPPESSAVPFLAKPFRAQELLAAVDALLAARRAN
jgi:DNA-binding NtrC family response regulator